MTLKTIEYTLKSKPGIKIKMPAETRTHFCDLVLMLENSISLSDFKERMEKHSYFSGIEGVEYNNLVETAGKLKRTKSEKSTAKYMDDLYIQLTQRDLKSAGEDVQNMQTDLDKLYKQIYGKEE